MENSHKTVFVVGNSRSGTTLMSRIISKSKEIHSFQEIHFFESMVSVKRMNDSISFSQALSLTNKLIAIQEQGFYQQKDIDQFSNKSKEILDKMSSNFSFLKVYHNFLIEWTKFKGKKSACEQTPKNIYYLDIISSSIPNSKFIHLIRDPRDILLSQKYKWRRKFLGEPQMPYLESFRAWALYHPITISKLWLSSIESFEKFDSPDIINVKFEDLMNKPNEEVKRVCNFLNIPYSEDLLNVPTVGSSVSKDIKGQMGIRKNVTSNWQSNRLSKTEIFFMEFILKKKIKKYGYQLALSRPNIFIILFLILIFPIKVFLSFILNLSRMDNIFETIRKRI